MVMYQHFMLGASLKRDVFSAHNGNDNEHCTMCGAKFSENPDDLHEGYVTLNGEHWICAECMHDYQKEYRWTIVT